MWNKDEYFKGISIIKITFLIIFFFGAMVMIGQVRGEDNKSSDHLLEFNTSKAGWPTQLLYDSVNGCYQGTYKWIVMANPILLGTIPPPETQRAMVEHCFCVMDRIRLQYPYVNYMMIVTDQSIVGKLYFDTAMTCVRSNGTLKGIIILDKETDNSTVTDNETIIDNSTLKEETPLEELNQPKTKEILGDSETIFQG